MNDGDRGQGTGDGLPSAIGHRPSSKDMDRREAIAAMGLTATAAYGLPSPTGVSFRRWLSRSQAQDRFFTDAELATVTLLGDMLIPRDVTTGSASDAGVPAYVEFIVSISSRQMQTQWRDGLRWFDEEAGRRFTRTFVQSDEPQRRQILDDIAWPARARSELQPQATFFNRVRDLVAAGFFSSRMGIQDLGYLGGVFNPEWRGAPGEALRPLGLSYTEWDAKYGREAGRRAGGQDRPRGSDARRTTRDEPDRG